MKFDDGSRCRGGGAVGVGNLRPTARVGLPVGRVFGFGHRLPALQVACDGRGIGRDRTPTVVLPEDSHDGTLAGKRHVIDLPYGMKTVVRIAFHRDGFRPPTIEPFTPIRRDHEGALAVWPAMDVVRELRPQLVAWSGGGPAGGPASGGVIGHDGRRTDGESGQENANHLTLI